MHKSYRHLDQLLLDRIVELEAKNAQLENIVESLALRLEDLDGQEFEGWPQKDVEQDHEDEFVDLEEQYHDAMADSGPA